MSPRRRWYHAALGATALVVAAVGLGLLLEHTIGPGWANGGGPSGIAALPHHASHPSSQRIPPDVRQRLLKGPRLGGRYGGLNLSNTRSLARPIVQQIVIGAAVVLVVVTAHRIRRARRTATLTRY